MSAVLKEHPHLAPMREQDLAEVVFLERGVYPHPWTRGNFADSLKAGYECWTWRDERTLLGYFVLTAGAGEAHLLNLSVGRDWQRRGHGSALLRDAMRIARERGAAELFLEVRPSNRPAIALYEKFGFERVAIRRDYYPASSVREDAHVYRFAL